MKIKLADTNLCTGCAACHDICPVSCIDMECSDEGFLYPNINNDRCIRCGQCQKVCPILSPDKVNKVPFYKGYAAWAIEDIKRTDSTSGGVFKVLAEYGYSNGWTVIGAGFDSEFYLSHQITTNNEDGRAIYGSKYLQSDTRGIYFKTKEILESGRNVLFSGLPCQIDALKRYLPIELTKNLFTSELLCHGVPSPGIFNDYLEYLEIKHKKKIKSYNFRGKKFGWDKMAVEILFNNEKKKSYRVRYCPYHSWFGKHLSIRSSCFNCRYRTRERSADITLGDFWGVQYLLPNIEVSKGVSLVYVNTVKGVNLLESCADKFYLNGVDIEKSLEGRKTVLNNFDIPNKREEFMKDYKKLSIDDLIKKYPPATISETIISKLRSVMVK